MGAPFGACVSTGLADTAGRARPCVISGRLGPDAEDTEDAEGAADTTGAASGVGATETTGVAFGSDSKRALTAVAGAAAFVVGAPADRNANTSAIAAANASPAPTAMPVLKRDGGTGAMTRSVPSPQLTSVDPTLRSSRSRGAESTRDWPAA